MTGEKVKAVLQKYREQLEVYGPALKPERLEGHSTKNHAPYLGALRQNQHLKFMCEEAQRFVDQGRIEKAMRWLGFIQGWFWKSGIFSLDDLKNHSRPDDHVV